MGNNICMDMIMMDQRERKNFAMMDCVLWILAIKLSSTGMAQGMV